MVLINGQWQVKFPEIDQPVRFFLPVTVNIEIYPGGLAVDIVCHLAGWVKCFGICQVIYQLGKIPCHLVGVIGGHVLILQPAIPVFFYKKRLSQSIICL